MEGDSDGPSTLDTGAPRRREVYRVFSDDDSPLVQMTIHAVVEGQLEPGLLLSACPPTQEEIYLL